MANGNENLNGLELLTLFNSNKTKIKEPEESAWEREFRESGENISNALSNIIPDLKLAWESTKTATVDLVKPLFGEETQDDIEEYIVDQYAKIQKILKKCWRKKTNFHQHL